VLFVFVVLLHDRRRVAHVNVTAHPTAAWAAQQLREAWPWDTAPRFVIRDRDGIYGPDVQATMRAMGIEEVVIAPRAPWQNPFVERVTAPLVALSGVSSQADGVSGKDRSPGFLDHGAELKGRIIIPDEVKRIARS
jgi:hypothetical protein